MFEEIINNITKINSEINAIVWGIPILFLIIFTGIFYTIRTKGFQFTHVKDVYNNTIRKLFVKSEKTTEKNVLPPFQALTTALASTIGTGNIAGVSTAIFVGGAGSIFWMWISAIFGMMTHFAEICLGLYFRKKTDDGYKGGAMYYLEFGVGKKYNKVLGKILAIAFALFAFTAATGTGNMTQINSISEALKANFSLPPLITGIVFALLTTLIIMGGITRIGQVTEKLVPFMSVFYLVVGFIILFTNLDHIPHVFYNIFACAFNTKAIAGGVFGIVIRRAMTYGFKRGCFSNEAGLGTSVFAHTTTAEKEPVKQAMWGVFEVFFDTIIVCTFTAIIILSTTMNNNTLNDTLNNLTINESISMISDEKNEKDERYLVNDTFYKMPIKVDINNNATLHATRPNDNKNYMEVKAYNKTYYVEVLDEKDATENDYFFGNALRVYANPIKHTNSEIIYDENNNPQVDSLHIEKINGSSLVTLAVSTELSSIAGKILAIAITLFAFSTLVGWSYYGARAVEYLFGPIVSIIYKVLYIGFVVVGATMKLDLIWDVSDTLNGMMAYPNLIGVLLLSGTTLKILKNYFDRKNGKDIKPMISYFDGNEV